MTDFQAKVAVVTGGASGIGRAMAERFAEEGMRIVIADVEQSALERTEAEMIADGAEVIAIRCDVSKAHDVKFLAEETIKAFDSVHILCNNAGVEIAGSIWAIPLEDWEWVLGVNLWGVIHGLHYFVPLMLEHGQPSHIVNTASMAGLIPGGGIYGVTKHAVVSLSESLFGEFAAREAAIGVSVLCPGWVNTNILESERNRPEEPREDPGELAPQFKLMRQVVEDLVKKGLDPREVGNIVVDAVRDRRFYVFTHPWQSMVERRIQNILQGCDPVGALPPGMDPELFGRRG